MTNSEHAGMHVAGTPTILHTPPDVHSLAAAEEAIEWGELYGLTLDVDQQATLRAALGERSDGSWAASEVGDFKGRQAGKNDTIKVRQGAGIDLFGERLIIHTAHEFSTANEDFLRLVATYENFDALRKTVARIRYANGEQGIEFRSGARIKYRARTGGAGRGFAKADLVIYDEAQHVQPEHLGASFPTMLASPNFQAWFSGSGGFESSMVAWRMRRRAILGDRSRMAYTENTAQIIRVVDGKVQFAVPANLLDEAVLRTHPGYASGRVSRETMETMYAALGPDIFGREILCIWEPEPTEDGGPVDATTWASLVDTGSKIASHRCIALDVTPARTRAAFAAAGRRSDGRLHVEPFDCRAGTGWVLDRAVELHAKWKLPIRVQKRSPAASFVTEMRERGVVVTEVSAEEHAAAVGQFLDACRNDQLRHLGNSDLTGALAGAVLQPSGDVELWGRRHSKVDISPLVAVTIALGGVPAVGRRNREFLLPQEGESNEAVRSPDGGQPVAGRV